MRSNALATNPLTQEDSVGDARDRKRGDDGWRRAHLHIEDTAAAAAKHP
jgi:hypothetical protein